MPPRRLEAGVRRRRGVTVIDLRGELDGLAERALDAALDRAESQEPPAVLLNFCGVDYINSKGIALIVTLLSRVQAAGRRLLACGLSDHYQEIFTITRLADFIGVYADEESALDALAQGSTSPREERLGVGL